MAVQLPPIPQDQIGENHPWRDWFRNLGNYIQAAQGGGVVWTIAQGGTGSSTAVGARSNLGIGSMGVQNSDNVAITGGTASGVAITGGTASGVGITGGTASGVGITGGTASGVGITGGTINGTPIGNVTPSTGNFTSLSSPEISALQSNAVLTWMSF